METIKYYWDVLRFAVAFIGFISLIMITGWMIGTFLATCCKTI